MIASRGLNYMRTPLSLGRTIVKCHAVCCSRSLWGDYHSDSGDFGQKIHCKHLSRPLSTRRSVRATDLGERISEKADKMAKSFSLSDYDYVGFDLDNTVLRYNVREVVEMEYQVLAKYLVQQKGYTAKLLEPLDAAVDFLQKGLILDCERGNVLRISRTGIVLRASHGTRFLSDDEIVAYYGAERRWNLAEQFKEDILAIWNGPVSLKLRNLLDYFDMPVSLLFSRIVDAIDAERGGVQPHYTVWPDILQGLVHIYSREHFESGVSEYFNLLRAHPDKFLLKTSPGVIEWLRELKRTKTTFLLTGSNSDFADFSAGYALGKQWRDLFDTVICFARKPAFFFDQSRPFINVSGYQECGPVPADQLRIGKLYTQGNARDLVEILKQKQPVDKPKVLYIGDNLIQDVFAPSTVCGWDAVAVSEELQCRQSDEELLTSTCWDSYFSCAGHKSFWSEIIEKHSRICVPSLDVLAQNPIDHSYPAFGEDSETRGYHK
ncbi:5'-nucleotidase domain-containing protein 1 [Phlebotomus argentipes]|uniref:5'-nucleotidase domain-containing protein 1 n=1 Tax=Phlebotomus argentipes TaxID=94469 RepID=UPI0028937F59|nr:5'-nucleotidase domain-containing protein 1 [Phlebotomus argentipes]